MPFQGYLSGFFYVLLFSMLSKIRLDNREEQGYYCDIKLISYFLRSDFYDKQANRRTYGS